MRRLILTMSKKKALFFIALGLIAAVLIPFSLRYSTGEPQDRVITLTAERYGYSPGRIVVNKGDRVIIKPTSLDATHGFLLDGYDIDAVIKQQGMAFLKYTWTDDDGQDHTDWDKVSEFEFTADRVGKFSFRCTQTCGNLHPFMIGELIVQENTPYHLTLSLAIWLTFSLLLWFFAGGGADAGPGRRINLFDHFPLLKRILKARSFQFMVIAPNLAFFYLLILSSLWGSPVGNRNIAIIFVWILWFAALKAIMVPFGGRVWCTICPLPAPGEWLARKRIISVKYFEKPFKGLHHRFFGLNLDWPKKLNNIWLQNALFLAMILFCVILLTRPIATAILFLMILAATIIFSLIYRRRAFCRYLCPVGGFLSTYSMTSVTELRVVDPDVCRKHKDKSCLTGGENGWACPWGEYIGNMDRNNNCGLCTECIKSCPKDNVALFLRPFASDVRLKGMDEVYNVFIMLIVALVFSVAMLGPWPEIKNAANVTETGDIRSFLIFVGVLLSTTLVIFPGLFFLACRAAKRISGTSAGWKEISLSAAYIFLPLGLFVWIAFSLPQVMINYGYILSVISDPLGFGWDIFGAAGLPFKPFYPESIPYVQGTLLLVGLYFGLTKGFRSLSDLPGDHLTRAKIMILPALLALGMTIVFLRLYMG